MITRAGNAGVDTFVREDKSLFVFFNGHPEYASNTLLLEYKRDVTRFVRNESQTYPLLPENYFAPVTADALKALELRAKADPSEERVGELAAILETMRMESTWHKTAVHIYKNWLRHISEQKKQSQENSINCDSPSAKTPSSDRSMSSVRFPALEDTQPACATKI